MANRSLVEGRFVAGVLAALACHGLVLAALGTFKAPEPPAPAPALVVVHVALPPRPDPVREELPAPPPAPVPQPVPAKPRARHAPRPRPRPTPAAVRDDRSDAVAVPQVPAPPPEPEPAPPVAVEPAPPAPPAVAPAPPKGPTVVARPRYRSNPRPDYPIQSLRHGDEGTVLLDVDVKVGGTASAVALKKSSGFPALDRAAIDAVWRWTFEPARVDGAAVASQVVVPVRFSLSDR